MVSRHIKDRHLQDWINLVLGGWLVLSPWFLDFASGDATLNAWIIGGLIVVVSFIALLAFRVWEEWINLALAAWLVVSPWVITMSDAAGWNFLLIGLAVAALSLWEIFMTAGRAAPRGTAGADNMRLRSAEHHRVNDRRD